mmetsp:Transcript_11263/g.22671  ORF Transcript_11263/g.22671 Transcript_11263/m.22671 type:complete len:626 (-) Transcript_11263:41-1918(-)
MNGLFGRRREGSSSESGGGDVPLSGSIGGGISSVGGGGSGVGGMATTVGAAAGSTMGHSSTVGTTTTPSGFDPTGLERAAKAARELDASRNATGALELVREQERTKQAEAQAKANEMEAYSRQLEVQRVEREGEQRRKTLEQQAQQQGELERYRDQLERKRQQDIMKQQVETQRMMQEEARRKEEESVARQEALRRKTLEYEAELRQGTEVAKVKAEAEGRIWQERKNHDIHMEDARLQAREQRRTILEGIRLAGATIGEGFNSFLADRDRMVAAVGTISAISLGIYTARAGTGIAGRYIEARLGKPSLVRETSRVSMTQLFRSPLAGFQRIWRTEDPADALKGIVLNQGLNERLKRIAVSTANAKKNRAPFRSLLLHGPPGTGKTMFAKSLAKHSGLEYAIMTGGDVAPLGKEAVTELHKLFDWSKSSRRGLLLFIDEADAFLRSRSGEKISEELRSALNAFLYRTGESSDRYMVVYASNAPEQFDWAANDRIDEVIEFGLPGKQERLDLLKLYFRHYIENKGESAGQAKAILVSGITDDDFARAADATEGFSGREISKLAIAWQAAAYGSEAAEIDQPLFHSVLRNHLHQKATKNLWHQSTIPTANSDDLLSQSRSGLASAIN